MKLYKKNGLWVIGNQEMKSGSVAITNLENDKLVIRNIFNNINITAHFLKTDFQKEDGTFYTVSEFDIIKQDFLNDTNIQINN